MTATRRGVIWLFVALGVVFGALFQLRGAADAQNATGRITIEKFFGGGTDVFSFSAPGLTPSTFTLDTDEGDATHDDRIAFEDVPIGSYTITEEALPPGVGLVDFVCFGDTDRGNVEDLENQRVIIDLDANESILCRFVNQVTSIQIAKSTIPDGGAGFEFSHNIDSSGNFFLDDGQRRTFERIDPGTYSVTELDPAPDHVLIELVCIDFETSDSTGVLETRTATIEVSPGDLIFCFFVNQDPSLQGTIKVRKVTDPPGGAEFDFELTGPLTNESFTLDDGDEVTFSNLLEGFYQLDEISDLLPLSIVCDDPDTELDPEEPTAGIELDDGETVTCTYTNAGPTTGSIVIVKDAVPNTATDFDFTISGGLDPAGFKLDDDSDPTLPNMITYSNVAPGSYSVTEAVAAGFASSVTCNDPDGQTIEAGLTATIDLDAGETVVCTFVNVAQADSSRIRVRKVLDGNDLFEFGFFVACGTEFEDFDVEEFFLLRGGQSRGFDTNGDVCVVFEEPLGPGWEQTVTVNGPGVVSTDVDEFEGVRAVFFEFEPGSDVTVRFTNSITDPYVAQPPQGFPDQIERLQ